MSITGVDLVLGLPAGQQRAANALNRDETRERIAADLEELLGVRYVIRAEEQAGVAAPEEPLLPEDEVVRRLVSEFEAEEVDGGASAAAGPGAGDPTSAETTTSTNGDS